MEFPTVGTHCGETTCKQLDFLPMTCDACKKEFCQQHYNYEAHQCKESYIKDRVVPVCPLCNSPIPVRRGDDPNIKINQHIELGCNKVDQTDHKAYVNSCSKKGCKKRELIPVTCATCRQNFCLTHRLEASHGCTGKPDPRAQAAAAARMRAQSNPRTGPRTGRETSNDLSTRPQEGDNWWTTISRKFNSLLGG